MLLSLLGFVVLTACGGGGNGGNDGAPGSGTASQYFPKTAIGNTWSYNQVYTSTLLGQTTTSTDIDTIKVLSFDGVVVTFSETMTLNGSTYPLNDFTVQIDATGSMISSTGIAPNVKTIVMLPASFSVGTTWVSQPGEPLVGRSDVKATITAFNVTRTVPAGTFTDCMQIDYTWSLSGAGITGSGKSTSYVSRSGALLVEEVASESFTIDSGSFSSTFTSQLQRYTVY